METIRKVRLGTSSLVKDTTQDLRLSQWEKAVQDQQRESQDSPMDRLRTCSFTEPPPHPHALPYYSLATFPPKIPRPHLQWHIEFSFLDKVTFSFNKTRWSPVNRGLKESSSAHTCENDDQEDVPSHLLHPETDTMECQRVKCQQRLRGTPVRVRLRPLNTVSQQGR